MHGSMAHAKSLLLLGVFIVTFWGQSSSSSGTKTPEGVKRPLPVVNKKSVRDVATHQMQWEQFKSKRNPAIAAKNEKRSKKLFLQNLKFIENRSNQFAMMDTFKLEMNQKFGIADFTNIKDQRCISENSNYSCLPCLTKILSLNNTTPQSMDWRWTPTRVGHVKDQGSCTSCWAFSAVAVLEGWFAFKHRTLVEFSPQQLLDCHSDKAGKSCEKHRRVPDAFKILKTLNGSLATLEAYPYKKESGHCLLTRKIPILEERSIFNFTGNCSKIHSSESQLKEAVARYGPVSVSIFTQLQTFKFYKSGIYNDKNCSKILPPSHAVTVVGFGIEETKSYWIIKNSWGTEWGEDGYMRLAMGDNLCGIANYGYFITEANDKEGDVPPFGRCPKPIVGSGSSSLHGTSADISGKIICFAIISCLVCGVFTEPSY